MKIYTKRGDTGETSLFGGKKTKKSHVRIHAYGTVDELNSAIGMVLSYPISETGTEMLNEIQNNLFIIGASLATPDTQHSRIPKISKEEIEQVEKWIDQLVEELPPLKTFILPGGSQAGATLHFARTVCRRAERHAVELSHKEDISQLNIIYLNRLSDFLFVLARFENKKEGMKETPWTSPK